VGQEHVTRTLRHAIEQGRIAHAYLFCGPRGTGKTTIARIFAKCLNCTGGPRLDFADDDPRCQEITEGRSLDVLEIDGASNRGIDEIRALRDTVKYAPAASRFKVYIIDEVHMLTKEAFNALLKTLEEPPAHVKFMFATTEPEKVLPTILSRCQRFDLRRIPAALIVNHLALIARQEATSIDEAALYAIARGADGGMRDAESTLDQLISFCGSRIEESDVLSMFGMAGQGQVRALFRAVLAGEPQTAFAQLDELCRNGKDLGRLLGDLLNHGRNLLLTLVSGGKPVTEDLGEAEILSLQAEARTVAISELTRIMEVLAGGERALRDSASRRIAFEVCLLSAMEARRAVPVEALLQQLQQLRSSSGPTDVAAASKSVSASAGVTTETGTRRVRSPSEAERSAPNPASPESPVPIPAPQADAEPAGVAARASVTPEEGLGRVWSQLLGSLATTHRFVQSYLAQAVPVSLDRGVLTIAWGPEVADQMELVNTDRNKQVIQQRLTELGLEVSQVRFAQSSEPTATPAAPSPASDLAAAATAERVAPVAATPNAEPQGAGQKPRPNSEPRSVSAATPGKAEAPAPFDKEAFMNDPMIRKALEVFRGHIAEVRG